MFDLPKDVKESHDDGRNGGRGMTLGSYLRWRKIATPAEAIADTYRCRVHLDGRDNPVRIFEAVSS